MESITTKRCIWASNAIGFDSNQLAKVFNHYGKIERIVMYETDGEVLIVYVDSDSATKALSFDGKSAKGSTLGVKRPTKSQFECVAHLVSDTDPPESTFLSLMEKIDVKTQSEILQLLKHKQSVEGSQSDVVSEQHGAVGGNINLEGNENV